MMTDAEETRHENPVLVLGTPHFELRGMAIFSGTASRFGFERDELTRSGIA